jgi:cytochrome c
VAKCQACHGEKGTEPSDALAGALVGGMGRLAPDKIPMKTVGSFWPRLRRAMPFQESKSPTADELYAVSAYILNLNGIVGSNDVIDAQLRPKVRMPNRDGLIPFPRNPKTTGKTSLRAIAAGLNEANIPTARGGEWSSAQVLERLDPFREKEAA